MARAGWQDIASQTGQTWQEARHDALDLVPLKRASDPDEIAALVSFLMGAGGRSFTGQAIDPNGGSWMG